MNKGYVRRMFGCRCEACGKQGIAEAFDVVKRDVSVRFDLPRGSVYRNVCHCAGSPDCARRALAIADRFLIPKHA
ncbi:MAG: hypothetical protein AAF961_05250 [Planctomycetota bacterium]